MLDFGPGGGSALQVLPGQVGRLWQSASWFGWSKLFALSQQVVDFLSMYSIPQENVVSALDHRRCLRDSG